MYAGNIYNWSKFDVYWITVCYKNIIISGLHIIDTAIGIKTSYLKKSTRLYTLKVDIKKFGRGNCDIQFSYCSISFVHRIAYTFVQI